MRDKILILTHRFDSHADVIQHCLAREGVDSFTFRTDLFSNRYQMNFAIGDATPGAWTFKDDGKEFALSDVTAVWNRRFVNPIVPGGDLSEEERKIAVLELSVFSQALFASVCLQARWANAIPGETRARSKILQLIAAVNAGLTIPDTVIGNAPTAIRDFVGTGDRIYKTFVPHVWQELNQTFSTPTTRVRLDDLPANDMLQLIPGIFQSRVAKTSDIRLFICGDHHVALDMPLRDNPKGANDFRDIPLLERNAQLIGVPIEVLGKCKAMMEELGIVTGSLDFLLDEDGRWVFLEVNSAGQFLWMEQIVPEARVLAKFLNFLAPGTAFDQYRFADVVAELKLRNKDLGQNFAA